MAEPRQRNIPLNINERRELDKRKKDYEDRTGDAGDWGKFLGVATLAGLAALGVYALAQATKRAPTVWQVNCPHCSTMFPIQIPNPPPWRVTQIACPSCSAELVIDFTRPASNISNVEPNSPVAEDTVYTVYCHYCKQPFELMHSNYKLNPDGAEYIKCPNCGSIGTYALLGVQ